MYEPGKPAYNKIVETFGKEVVGENGEINRKEIGAIVFKDPVSLGIIFFQISISFNSNSLVLNI